EEGSQDQPSPAKSILDRLPKSLAKNSVRDMIRRSAEGDKDLKPRQKADVLHAVNDLFTKADFYSPEFFPNVELTEEEQTQLEGFRDPDGLPRGLTPRHLRVLNRGIAQRAFPELIQADPGQFVLRDMMNEHPSLAHIKGLGERPDHPPAEAPDAPILIAPEPSDQDPPDQAPAAPQDN
ncbi:MAG: hypothetical protein N2C14_18705, partial [Planctomycetales bacterium]